MTVANKLKHLAILLGDADIDLEQIAEYCSGIGLERLDIYCTEAKCPQLENLVNKQQLNAGQGLLVRVIKGSARERLLTKIQNLDQGLDYMDFVAALVPQSPDLIVAQAQSLRSMIIEEAAYAEIFFIKQSVIGLEVLKLAVEDFEQRKRNFGA